MRPHARLTLAATVVVLAVVLQSATPAVAGTLSATVYADAVNISGGYYRPSDCYDTMAQHGAANPMTGPPPVTIEASPATHLDITEPQDGVLQFAGALAPSKEEPSDSGSGELTVCQTYAAVTASEAVTLEVAVDPAWGARTLVLDRSSCQDQVNGMSPCTGEYASGGDVLVARDHPTAADKDKSTVSLAAGEWRAFFFWTRAHVGVGDSGTMVRIRKAGPRITGGPTGPTLEAGPEFSFESSEAVKFECKVDSGPPAADAGVYQACVSPWRSPAVGPGPHTFFVREVVDDVPGAAATRSFVVIEGHRTAPPGAPLAENLGAGPLNVASAPARELIAAAAEANAETVAWLVQTGQLSGAQAAAAAAAGKIDLVAPAAGTVSVSVSAGKTLLATAGRRFASAGRAAVPLPLTAAGKRAAKRSAIAVKVTATIKPDGGSPSSSSVTATAVRMSARPVRSVSTASRAWRRGTRVKGRLRLGRYSGPVTVALSSDGRLDRRDRVLARVRSKRAAASWKGNAPKLTAGAYRLLACARVAGTRLSACTVAKRNVVIPRARSSAAADEAVAAVLRAEWEPGLRGELRAALSSRDESDRAGDETALASLQAGVKWLLRASLLAADLAAEVSEATALTGQLANQLVDRAAQSCKVSPNFRGVARLLLIEREVGPMGIADASALRAALARCLRLEVQVDIAIQEQRPTVRPDGTTVTETYDTRVQATLTNEVPLSNGDNAGVATGIASGSVMGPPRGLVNSVNLLLNRQPRVAFSIANLRDTAAGARPEITAELDPGAASDYPVSNLIGACLTPQSAAPPERHRLSGTATATDSTATLTSSGDCSSRDNYQGATWKLTRPVPSQVKVTLVGQ